MSRAQRRSTFGKFEVANEFLCLDLLIFVQHQVIKIGTTNMYLKQCVKTYIALNNKVTQHSQFTLSGKKYCN